MEWDKIENFYYVAKAKGFSSAAAQIHLSQSALSRSIAKLEEQLGKKLFIRHAKGGLAFTREGEILFKLAEKMILDIHATKKIILGDESNIEGELRILTSPSLAADWLPFLVRPFLRKHPKIKFKIVGEISETNYHAYDIIIQPALLQHPDFIQEYLLSFKSALFAIPLVN